MSAACVSCGKRLKSVYSRKAHNGVNLCARCNLVAMTYKEIGCEDRVKSAKEAAQSTGQDHGMGIVGLIGKPFRFHGISPGQAVEIMTNGSCGD